MCTFCDINVTAVHNESAPNNTIYNENGCALARSFGKTSHFMPLNWISPHMSMDTQLIQSLDRVHDLFASEDKKKPPEIILIMRKIRSIKWWVYTSSPNAQPTTGHNKEERCSLLLFLLLFNFGARCYFPVFLLSLYARLLYRAADDAVAAGERNISTHLHHLHHIGMAVI